MRGLIYEAPDLTDAETDAVTDWMDARVLDPDASFPVDLTAGGLREREFWGIRRVR